MDQSKTPLYEALYKYQAKNPVSAHVPGHKNGEVFPFGKENPFYSLLKFDLTELPGLDDLHQPESAIKEAEQLTSDLYGANRSFFLVNGTTGGNLAMVLAVCSPGEEVIVQRNSHKSIIHALELAGAKPVFVTPNFDDSLNRYIGVSLEQVTLALKQHPHAKAIILTYPDYFGVTYPLEEIIKSAHSIGIPVLIDEAHGAHFTVGEAFPTSALDLGADVVVHSAHKTLPAMTMGSYLHVNSRLVEVSAIRQKLQMLQSSSPSYPIMASLDLARKYVANVSQEQLGAAVTQAEIVREMFRSIPALEVPPCRVGVDDPLKVTITSNQLDMNLFYSYLFNQGIACEMVENNQLLMILGLEPSNKVISVIKQAIHSMSGLEKFQKHDRIEYKHWCENNVQQTPYSFSELHKLETEWVKWEQAVNRIAAEAITPYPPGIPILIKGERVSQSALGYIQWLINQDQYMQSSDSRMNSGIEVYIE
ncbi:aminotransferase class I/II-fold pyridoxal phosphate-dependent enzyme [Halalkalibacillus halophilus]|uniref:aminotransferase class I/II-fold pyridoxal phosphate-dependent enzyme n=1 Tax=Halalkalibacillus halophilus TaxID=392827 RepID=UPI000415E21E|nr:aminotransferase class I/II-fold pyridoxal phosphate-dependent enzyme [Halalkalibacillus halophilus]